jgi:hypothetical protein
MGVGDPPTTSEASKPIEVVFGFIEAVDVVDLVVEGLFQLFDALVGLL